MAKTTQVIALLPSLAVAVLCLLLSFPIAASAQEQVDPQAPSPSGGKAGPSEEQLRRDLAEAEKKYGPGGLGMAKPLVALGKKLHAQRKFAEAESLFARAEQIVTRRLPKSVAEAQIRHARASILRNLGRCEDAEAEARLAIDLYSSLDKAGERVDDVGLARWVHARALTCLGRSKDAEEEYRAVLAMFERRYGWGHPRTLDAAKELGSRLRVIGKAQESQRLLTTAVVNGERSFGPDHPGLASALVELARSLSALGQKEDALAVLQRAQRIYASSGSQRGIAEVLVGRSQLDTDAGRYDAAENSIQFALAILNSILPAGHIVIARTMGYQAYITSARGDHTKAESQYRGALAAASQVHGPDSPLLEDFLFGLGSELVRAGKLNEAQTVLSRSLSMSESARGAGSLRVASSLDALGEVELARGRWAEAESRFERATAILSQAQPPAESEEGRGSRVSHRKHYAMHLESLSRIEIATGTPSITRKGLRVMQQAKSTQTAAATARMVARFAGGDDEIGRAVRQYQDAVEKVAALESEQLAALREGATELAAIAGRLATARSEAAMLKAALDQRFPAYATLAGTAPVDLPDLQAILKPDELVLNWYFGKDAGYLVAIRQGNAAFIRLDLPLRNLSADVAQLRQALRVQSGAPFPASTARRLYRNLIAPAGALLEGVEYAYVVPDGPLESLPLSVLIVEAGGQPEKELLQSPEDMVGANWLVKKWAISTLPSVAAFRALRQITPRSLAPRAFLGIGDPLLANHPSRAGAAKPAAAAAKRDVDSLRGHAVNPDLLRQLPSLPATAVELELMAEILKSGPDSLVLRERATEAAVKRLPLDSYRVIALSTHGAMAGEGLGEPGLILTPEPAPSPEDEGYLSASEITRLKLNADWVILSACNTAASDGSPKAEGLSGLGRAFMYAGARSLFVSHWSVADVSTAYLTTSMIANAATGLPSAQAHRRAMLEFLLHPKALQDPRRRAFTHPAFWAPFVVVGDGRMVTSVR